MPKILHYGSDTARDGSKPGPWGRRQHGYAGPARIPRAVRLSAGGYAPGAHRNQHQERGLWALPPHRPAAGTFGPWPPGGQVTIITDRGILL